MPLTLQNMNFLKVFFEEKLGIKITSDKEYLIQSRLSAVIKTRSLGGFNDLVLAIRMNNKDIITECIDAITTNETHFFRDIRPFEFFEKEIISKQFVSKPVGSNIRILSAACSSGQEAYSIAISMYENRHKFQNRNFEIIGFDISKRIVERAKQATYSQFEIQRGLPMTKLVKYFDKVSESEWKVKDSISQYCKFYEKNIFTDMASLGEFDIIFCRNVLIYFDDSNKKKALMELVKRIRVNSYIILGASETTNILPELLQQNEEVRSAFRRKG